MKHVFFAAAVVIVLISSCDGCSCAQDWDVPPAVAFRRMAAARHELCVQNNPCYFVSQCHRESELYCLDAGYPKECGNSEQEGSCGVGVK